VQGSRCQARETAWKARATALWGRKRGATGGKKTVGSTELQRVSIRKKETWGGGPSEVTPLIPNLTTEKQQKREEEGGERKRAGGEYLFTSLGVRRRGQGGIEFPFKKVVVKLGGGSTKTKALQGKNGGK